MYKAYNILIIILLVSFITGSIIMLLEHKQKNTVSKKEDLKLSNILLLITDKIETFLYYFTLILSKGFFFYFYILFYILHKIIPLEVLKKIKVFFKEKQSDTIFFLSIIFVVLIGIFIYSQFYIKNDLKHVSKDIYNNTTENINNTESNLYRRYASYNINNLDFNKLKKDNKDIVSWLMVDSTNINYPIVQTTDNKYYLNHDIKNNVKGSGWPFMDYRNDKDLNDDNTIFYGHNLVNKTSFGSLDNLFKKDWFNNSNHYIALSTGKNKYIYEIFSVYIVEPETYYLQNNFILDDDKEEFYNTLKKRSIYNFNIDLNKKDKIITLSTCTEDNKKRKVVHAKLIKK